MPKLCGIISDKPKHKNSNKIPGFNQITIWGLQTDKATGGYCLAFFPLYVICLCPFPQGSLCISAFHFPFYLFVCCCSWLQLPSGTTDTWGWGGGGGRIGGEKQTCLQSQLWGIFMFAGNSWKYVELPEIWILSQSKKQQQPRLIKKKLVWELLRISIWTQSLRMCKSHTHTVLFLEGLFECAKDRAKKVFF